MKFPRFGWAWTMPLALLAAMLTRPVQAEAHLIEVYYNPTNAPIMSSTGWPIPSDTMQRIIMASLREIEAHSNGRLTFVFKSTTASPPCGLLAHGGRGILKVRWEPGLTQGGCMKNPLTSRA